MFTLKRELIITSDGSHTIQLGDSGITYHSIHGAITESMHVFVKSGLNYFMEKYRPAEIKIFEMGFGTGLNCLLTALSVNPEIKVDYHTIETNPLSQTEIDSLNYPASIKSPGTKNLLKKIHDTGWNQPSQISPDFLLTKLKTRLEDASLPPNYFDIIYYDAFAPSAQPELWTKEIFKKLFDALHSGGILTTYCSKGEVRRNLQHAGFSIEKLQGPPRKREIIRATKA